jgi:hypothetical protein
MTNDGPMVRADMVVMLGVAVLRRRDRARSDPMFRAGDHAR